MAVESTTEYYDGTSTILMDLINVNDYYYNNKSNDDNYEEDCSSGYLTPDNSMASAYFYGSVYAMYCPMFVIGLLGNGMVCFIVASTPRMKTVTNLFIANLAVGDLLMAIFCIPFTFMPMFILHYWPFGETMCPVVNYTQAVSVFVSAYTLVAISIDRYVAILWPLKPRLTKKYAAAIIFAVWLFAVITALPIPIFSQLTQPSTWHEDCAKFVCREVWPTVRENDIYNIALMLLQFVIPLVVLIFTYTSIAVVVWGRKPPGEAENSRDQRFARSKRKMIKMMLAVVVVFTLCWLPFNTLVVVSYTGITIEIPGLPYMWLGLHWLAMSHSCYNPIIYCYMNARFRAGFLQMLASMRCCERCLPALASRNPRASIGFGLTGSDSTENTMMHRLNTCGTYVTMRHNKTISTYQQHPMRSASVMRYSNRSVTNRPHQRQNHMQPESIHEDQI